MQLFMRFFSSGPAAPHLAMHLCEPAWHTQALHIAIPMPHRVPAWDVCTPLSQHLYLASISGSTSLSVMTLRASSRLCPSPSASAAAASLWSRRQMGCLGGQLRGACDGQEASSLPLHPGHCRLLLMQALARSWCAHSVDHPRLHSTTLATDD